MSSRTATRAAVRALKQASRPAVQQRTFITAINAGRQTAAKQMPKAVAAQQIRGVKTVDFAGHKEQVFGESWSSWSCGD